MYRQNMSLNALRVLESAARLLSFTLAAQELHITQAAVSQQIRRLEEQLGVALFQRKARKLVLLPAGAELAETTRFALNSIFDVVDRITEPNKGVLTISTLPSFASRWLIPRLVNFQHQHRSMELHVHTSEKTIEFSGTRINAAIRMAATAEPGLYIKELLPDAMCLVCTPDIVKNIGSDIEKLYLYKLAIDDSHFLVDGNKDLMSLAIESSLQQVGIDRSRINTMAFNQSDNVVVAALAGQVVALTRLVLCADDLNSGRLKILFNYCQPTDYYHSLVYPVSQINDPDLIVFEKWLVEQSTQFRNLLLEYI